MPLPPWSQTAGLQSVLDSWQTSGPFQGWIAASDRIGAREATVCSLPNWLHPALRKALQCRGVVELYSHQKEAIDAAHAGQHVVVATPTASGKSLCFHLPVLQALLDDPGQTALFLYPTKALSRDQEHGLHELLNDAELPVPVTVYDGDTPGDARRAARDKGRIILTNPDMLHSGILPNHARWASLLQGLKYVVIDELHTYRGVFGSHMAHVLMRLRRIAEFHGSRPQFLTATATIGNPLEHTARLLGVPESEILLVDKSGAPQAEREFFVINPPIVNAELGIRQSTLKTAVAVASDLIRARVPTIVFGPSRNSVEVMLKYLRESASPTVSPNAIMGYRGGYLPDHRRAVEQGLRDGEILGVVTTNALELGIDIGDLDAVVLAGYAGSCAATWQRFGRAGRRGKKSAAIMVCSSNAMDQYLARDPRFLLQSNAEQARIDPNNVEILIQHLKCATFEAPFNLNDSGVRVSQPQPAVGEHYGVLDAQSTRDALQYLQGHGLVHSSQGRYFWAGDPFPANHVSLRNIGWDNFVIIDVGTDATIGELDWRAAHTMLHEQAIYQQDAEQYQVEKLDFENHKAYVRKVAPDYFTTALTYRTVSVIEQQQQGSCGSARTGFGEVKVLEKVTGYKKIKFFTHENAGYGDVHLPEIQMHTQSFWLTLPEEVIDALPQTRAATIAGLRGLGQALETVSTLVLMCDPRDINRTLGDGANDEGAPGRDPLSGKTGGFDPTLFLFDAVAGGIGLSIRIFEQSDELLARARRLIERCSCRGGCPACVGPNDDALPSVRQPALAILNAIGAR
jgi:DEAD/DEAH box helicase domain-containing protein